MLKRMKIHLSVATTMDTVMVGNSALAATRIEAPVGMASSVGDLISDILSVVFSVAGVIVLIYLIVGGFTYLTSGGNEKQVTDAKNKILYSIIGLVIIAAAFALKTFILKTIIGQDVTSI